MRILVPLTALLTILQSFVHASIVVPDDGPYYRLRRDPILYVYDDPTREAIPQVSGYMQAIRGLYDKSFNWKLDEEEDLILTSTNQQVANAYATVSPNIKSVWFPGGPLMLENMAESSWFLTLATHETSHLYQLNAKSPFGSGLKTVLGNSTYSFIEIPLFVHPNQFAPTFLLEGNAVLNESRANLGGRLHSGEVRATVLAQIKKGEINPTRLINDEFKYPFGENAYIQGGYFQGHLAGKYGVDKTNQFFVAQGVHWFNPLILNQTFRDHFGASYPQEIHEYVREMEGLAKKQQVSAGKEIAQALFISPLNRVGDSIYFVTSDGITTNTLVKLQDGQIDPVKDMIDVPLGKVFIVDNEPKTAASEQHDLHHIEYSLYGEHQAFDPKFVNQIVSDQRAGKTVALDAHNTWLESHVLVNGETYDIGHSMPILDEEGNVYYFRQNGAERILYRNRQPVFKFDGFYGKLMEVGPDGGVYFIANTDYGSTLYEYKNKEVFRVLTSDVVTNARRITENHFLAVEAEADGTRAVITEAARKPAVPANYSYGFPSYNLMPDKMADREQLKEDERPYNSLSQIRYSSLNVFAWYDPWSGLTANAAATFTDPLEYQLFTLGAQGTSYSSKSVTAGYMFSKYLLKPEVHYVYQDLYWHQYNQVSRQAFDQQALVGFTLPFWQWREWSASWQLLGEYGRNDNQIDPTSPNPQADLPAIEETWGAFNTLSVKWTETADPNLALYPWRGLSLTYQNKLESYPGSWAKKYNTSLVQGQYIHGFAREFYASFTGSLGWAENHDIAVRYDPMPLTTDIRMPRLVNHNPYVAKTASSAHLEVAKVFTLPAYLPRFPVSVERVSPFVVAQGMAFDNDGIGNGGYPNSLFEYGFGADIQLLLAHKFAGTFRLMEAFDATDPVHAKQNGDTQALLTSKYSF